MTSTSAEYCTLSVQRVCDILELNQKQGLSYEAADARRLKYGPNTLDLEQKESITGKFFQQFQNPLILLLLGSAVLSTIVGHIEDAISIALTIIIVLSGINNICNK